MQIGDKVRLHTSQSKPGEKHEGVVEYIQPAGRFYSVRFSFQRMDGSIQSYRESFLFPAFAGDPQYNGAASPEAKKESARLHYQKKRK